MPVSSAVLRQSRQAESGSIENSETCTDEIKNYQQRTTYYRVHFPLIRPPNKDHVLYLMNEAPCVDLTDDFDIDDSADAFDGIENGGCLSE
jgi:hypothetical protein